MKILRHSLLLGTILFLTGCSVDWLGQTSIPSSTDDNNNNNSNKDGEDQTNVGVALKNTQEYLTFWDPSSVLSFSITMSNDVAYKISSLQNDSASQFSDYYFPCTLTYSVNGKSTTLEEVGIRMKGNTSRREYCDSEGNFYDKCHYKLKLNETFDGDEYQNVNELKSYYHEWENKSDRKARKNRTICDMEKLNIKWNKNYDGTLVKQSYAYKLFRDEGVITCHSTIAPTTINTQNDSINGTYEVLEEIDEVLISRYFSEEAAGGDLYKCSWGATFANNHKVGNEIGVEDYSKNFHPIYDLKTNKKKSNHSDLLNLISVINDKTTNANEYKNKLEKVLNVKSFLTEEACAYLLGNPDDIRNNKNNFYIYFDSVNHKGHFIPYDFDRCLGIGKDWNPDGEYLKGVWPTSTKMKGNNSNYQENNLFWRTIINDNNYESIPLVDDYYNMYKAEIEKIINDKIMSVQSFEEYVNSFPSSYRGDPNGTDLNPKNGDEYENISFKQYFNAKVNAVKTCGYNIK